MVLWVFGYASLLWKPGFYYDHKIIGFVKNYRRTFHLACMDHRGTPQLPARAANLDPEEGAICWGIAYCINDDEDAKQVISYLKLRECEYDAQAHVDFFTEQSSEKPLISNVLVFITTPDKMNKYYLGPAPLEEMASQIARAKGPSGPSYEYIFRLEEALMAIGHEDNDVIKLAGEVKIIISDSNGFDLDNHSKVKESNQKHDNGCTHTSNNLAQHLSFDLGHASLTLLNSMPHTSNL